jgi:hypothetical protein
VKVDIDPTESDLDSGAAGDERRVVATVDPGSLGLDELCVQVAHGPVTADGAFVEHRLAVLDMERRR